MKNLPFDFDAVYDSVEKEMNEEVGRKSNFLRDYYSANLPIHRKDHLDPKKKYRVYSFLIKRTVKDPNFVFKTLAIDSTDAIHNVECMFGRSVSELTYLSPLSVSKPNYPRFLLTKEGHDVRK